MNEYLPWAAFVFQLIVAVVTVVWALGRVESKTSVVTTVLSQQIQHLAEAIKDLKVELRVFDDHHSETNRRLALLEQQCAVFKERFRLSSGDRLQPPPASAS